MQQIKAIIVLVSLLIICMFIRGSIGFIVIITFFLGVIGYNVIRNFVEYSKARKGPFSQGRLIIIEKISNEKILDANWQIEIEFNNPEDGKFYRKKFYLFSFKKPNNQKDYKICVNTSHVEKSILVNKFDLTWLSITVLGLSLWLYLFTRLLKELSFLLVFP